MTDKPDPRELEFFGAVTAAISHDINNRLAVINESAGLLEDYIRVLEKGGDLDPGKFGRIAETVKKNVSRANEIVKTLNRFAHTADKPVELLDLQDVVELSSLLCGRILQKHDVSLEVDPACGPATTTTSRYHLLNLIWICIANAVENASPGGSLRLTCGKHDDKAFISIRISTSNGAGKKSKLPEYADDLAREIGFSVDENQADDTIVIRCRQ